MIVKSNQYNDQMNEDCDCFLVTKLIVAIMNGDGDELNESALIRMI